MAGRIGIINLAHMSLYEAYDATDRIWLTHYLESSPDTIAQLANSTLAGLSMEEAVWRGNLSK